MSSVKLLSKIQHGIAWSHGSFSSRGLFDFYCLPVAWQILWEVDSRVEAQGLKNTKVGPGIRTRHPTEEFGMLGTNLESVSIILAPA